MFGNSDVMKIADTAVMQFYIFATNYGNDNSRDQKKYVSMFPSMFLDASSTMYAGFVSASNAFSCVCLFEHRSNSAESAHIQASIC